MREAETRARGATLLLPQPPRQTPTAGGGAKVAASAVQSDSPARAVQAAHAALQMAAACLSPSATPAAAARELPAQHLAQPQRLAVLLGSFLRVATLAGGDG